ncbi:MAG TPA: DUF488 family protein [Syntrophorhabdaceae bacterium]|jgi:uncharacterized protein YeaO (DUF488 family)
MIKTKRVYGSLDGGGGTLILVDRLWPRGVAKEKLKNALWIKDVAPSETLRREFGHDPANWRSFRQRYLEELEHNRPAVDEIMDKAGRGDVVLLYAAKDEEHNNAVVLKEFLEERLPL